MEHDTWWCETGQRASSVVRATKAKQDIWCCTVPRINTPARRCLHAELQKAFIDMCSGPRQRSCCSRGDVEHASKKTARPETAAALTCMVSCHQEQRMLSYRRPLQRPGRLAEGTFREQQHTHRSLELSVLLASLRTQKAQLQDK